MTENNGMNEVQKDYAKAKAKAYKKGRELDAIDRVNDQELYNRVGAEFDTLNDELFRAEDALAEWAIPKLVRESKKREHGLTEQDFRAMFDIKPDQACALAVDMRKL